MKVTLSWLASRRTLSWLASRRIPRGASVYVWATDAAPKWQRLNASLQPPAGIEFDNTVCVADDVDVHLAATFTDYAPFEAIAIGYRWFPRPAFVAWTRGGAAGGGGTS